MRHLVAAGGLALAACVCGLLLSGAASAKQASDSITITGVLNGTTITFTVSSSPVGSISLFGGSNWHFTAASSAGGNCNLTPTDGGAFCSYASPVTSFTITTTITGTPPTAVAGQVGYADASTGQLSAPVSAAPTQCHCAKLSAAFTDFKEEHHGYILRFTVTWKMHCATGTFSDCHAFLALHHPADLPRGVLFREKLGDHWKPYLSGSETFSCKDETGSCPPTVTGELPPLELISHPDLRAGRTIVFPVYFSCPGPDGVHNTREEITLKFGHNGKLEPPPKSHLGKLG